MMSDRGCRSGFVTWWMVYIPALAACVYGGGPFVVRVHLIELFLACLSSKYVMVTSDISREHLNIFERPPCIVQYATPTPPMLNTSL